MVSAPGSGDANAPSSAPEPELRNTSRASWSDMSIRSICSRTSTFTSIEEMLPMGAVHVDKKNTQCAYLMLHLTAGVSECCISWCLNLVIFIRVTYVSVCSQGNRCRFNNKHFTSTFLILVYSCSCALDGDLCEITLLTFPAVNLQVSRWQVVVHIMLVDLFKKALSIPHL